MLYMTSLIGGVSMQAALITQALTSRDINKQTAAAPAPAKKPLRPAATVQSQNSKTIADDDDAALQVGAKYDCAAHHTLNRI